LLPSAHHPPVRPPVIVHHRRTSFDSPMRPAVLTGDDGISRLPRKVFPHMPGVFDRAGFVRVSRYRHVGRRLPLAATASAPRRACLATGFSFRGSTARPARAPPNASPSPLRAPPHDSSRCGSLGLHRMTLAFTTPCRLCRRTIAEKTWRSGSQVKLTRRQARTKDHGRTRDEEPRTKDRL
jgi:hypothetical protein